MRGVIQSRTGENGTCFRAALASILNLRESQVPDFPKANQDPGVDKFLSKYGLRYEEFPITEDNAPVGYHFILGISPRGGEHAIVGKDGRGVWDPHPASDGTGQGLVKPERYGVLVSKLAKDAVDIRAMYEAAKTPMDISAATRAYNKLMDANQEPFSPGTMMQLKKTAQERIASSNVHQSTGKEISTNMKMYTTARRPDLFRGGRDADPRADYERVATLQPTEVFQGYEYWRIGSDMYRNPVGNRGPIEPIGNTGKPGNARWECSVRDFPKMKSAYAKDGAEKPLRISDRWLQGRSLFYERKGLDPRKAIQAAIKDWEEQERMAQERTIQGKDSEEKPLWKQIDEIEARIRKTINEHGRANSKLPAMQKKLKALRESKLAQDAVGSYMPTTHIKEDAERIASKVRREAGLRSGEFLMPEDRQQVAKELRRIGYSPRDAATYAGKESGLGKDADPRAGVTKCQACGAPLNGDDVAEVNGKVVCPECADRRTRLHRALDCVMDRKKV